MRGHLLLGLVLVWPIQAVVGAAQSLDQLEQLRVITPQERRNLQRGALQTPIAPSALDQGCRSGALSRKECATGVAVRSGASRHQPRLDRADLAGGSRRPDPVVVPVSALLAGGTTGFRLESVFAVTPRPAAVRGNQDRRLLFPVLGQAVTSSAFGWRRHPVLQSWLMHAGRDFAAPEGTPVVAARSGRVMSSGLAGGYGLAVELEHQRPHRRTLYGHLSELYVRSGEIVRQGEVIGRVGNTGLSTGPHLHFEVRRAERGGWVAIEPGDLDPTHLGLGQSDAVALLVQQLMAALERP